MLYSHPGKLLGAFKTEFHQHDFAEEATPKQHSHFRPFSTPQGIAVTLAGVPNRNVNSARMLIKHYSSFQCTTVARYPPMQFSLVEHRESQLMLLKMVAVN